MNSKLPECFKNMYPTFYQKVMDDKILLLQIEEGASEAEIQEIERQIGIPLPHSYRTFLACSRGLILDEPMGSIYYPVEHLAGTICFGDYFLEADGDQVVFDISQGLIDGEYPVLYYAHDFAYQDNKGLRKIADSFAQWLENL